MTGFYTGVGSRTAPPDVRQAMQQLASWLALCGFTLRSGGADGADTAFEVGAGVKAHIYLPWPGFNGRSAGRLSRPTADAYQMASGVHPAYEHLSAGARALHARNCHQVLGDALNAPSDFLVCWTPDGCTGLSTRTKATGGTATAIVLAERHGVPMFNLKNPGSLDAVQRLCCTLVGQG